MRLQHLQAFLALAEELNFRLAAARPCLSQPGLSEQLQDLERELGVRLFSGTAAALGNTEAAVTLHIPGYRAHLARHGQTTVIHVGGDNMPSPDLQMTTTPYA